MVGLCDPKSQLLERFWRYRTFMFHPMCGAYTDFLTDGSRIAGATNGTPARSLRAIHWDFRSLRLELKSLYGSRPLTVCVML